MSYDYRIEYIKDTNNVIAACLSGLRVKLPTAQQKHFDAQINDVSPHPCRHIPLTTKDVSKATTEDPTLRKVTHCLARGWSSDLNPYY